MPRAAFLWAFALGLAVSGGAAWAETNGHEAQADFPPSLESYHDADLESIPAILAHRIRQVPFNLVATLIFFCAIVHTFMAGRFSRICHERRLRQKTRIENGEARPGSADIIGEVCHFLGEVEVIFGLWTIPLIASIVVMFGWQAVIAYFDNDANLTEAAFVVAIMVLASTRPILKLAESMMLGVSRVLGGSLSAFWFTALTIRPLLGSIITDPAAMTIVALLLSQTFYDLGPSGKFKYATLGQLFVNISVGGTLTLGLTFTF